jgi:hypothetical protein
MAGLPCRVCREPALAGWYFCENCNAMWETNKTFREIWGSFIAQSNTEAMLSAEHPKTEEDDVKAKARRRKFRIVK